MKWKLDRIISVATLVASVVAIVLVLKKPQPVAPAQSPAGAAANVQSLENKLEQLEQPKTPGQAPAQVHFSSDEITAALAQAVAALPANLPASGAMSTATAASPAQTSSGLPTTVPSSPDAAIGQGEPEVKDYKVNFDGDVARGQFVTQIGGKDVYVTLAGHLGSKDGYATFDPTEFKVGDLSIPVSMVSGALQKKLAEQRDRLKLPDDVGSVKVENGQLVATQK
ncbi:MAG TPA: hypothetical protein VNZ03_07660 [Terriglobales bacterium]|jgi:hypothetical protein|nr:hypothetical protein [Terriglobales bacterium]